MITVRFPNGQAVTYNDATHLIRSEDGWQLHTEKGGRWVASIQSSAGVIVEAMPPCSVSNPIQDNFLRTLRSTLTAFLRNLLKGRQ